MENNKMTIHRALSELKLIDAKISKQINELNPVAITQKDKKIGGYLSIEDFSKNAQSGFDSVNALIQRKIAIKSKIVESNSITEVDIAGKKYKVADAISFKKIIETKKGLINHLTIRFKQETANLNKQNESVNKNADNILQASVGGDISKISKDIVDQVTKPYLENNSFLLIDPLKIEAKILELEKETGDFEAEVDAILSESNAITFINL